MKSILRLMMVTVLSLTALTACNLGDNENEQPNDITYEPTNFDDNNRNNMDNNDRNRDRMEDRDLNENDDNPLRMDEEEPDLDEEPTEERRGQ